MFGGEGAEEGVGVGGAGGGAVGCEAVDEVTEAGAFGFEIGLVQDDEGLGGGGVFAHGLVVAEGQRFDDGTEEAADESSGRADSA